MKEQTRIKLHENKKINKILNRIQAGDSLTDKDKKILIERGLMP